MELLPMPSHDDYASKLRKTFTEDEYIERNMYDPSAQSEKEHYENLLTVDTYAKKHISPNPKDERFDSPERQLRRSWLNDSGMAGGVTNFWANPYSYHPKETPINYRAVPEMGPRTRAKVFVDNPVEVHYNPDVPYANFQSPSELIPHELGHTRQLLIKNREKLSGTPGNILDFSDAFLEKLRDIPVNPKFGFGFGYDFDETMGYFLGREGSLRQGQSIKDDPALRGLFHRFPKDYEVYLKMKQQYDKVK